MKMVRNLSLLLLLLLLIGGCSNRRDYSRRVGARKLSRVVVSRELGLLKRRTTRFNNRIDKEYVMKSDVTLPPHVKRMQKMARKMEQVQIFLKRKLKKSDKIIYFSSSDWDYCYSVGCRKNR